MVGLDGGRRSHLWLVLALVVSAGCEAEPPATWELSRPAGLPSAIRWDGPNHFVEREGIARAHADQLTIEASAEGWQVVTASGRWSLGLSTIGRGVAEPVALPQLAIDANRLGRRGERAREWVVVSDEGARHVLAIDARPEGLGSLRLEVGHDEESSTFERAPDGRGALLVAGGRAMLRYGDATTWDATGRVLPTRVSARDGRLSIVIDDAGATYPLLVDPLIGVEEAKLTASDAATGDAFGAAVALEGDLAVVGAPDAEAVYVFRRSGVMWTEQTILTASDAAAGQAFGAAVALDGDILVVGAPGDMTGRGALYVFDGSSGTFAETQKLTASDGAAGDGFGTSVDVAGTTAIGGAPSDGADVGAAYVFDESGGTWSETIKLTASDATAGDDFGEALALDRAATLAVVGAPGESGGFGAAYVFRLSGTWAEEDILTSVTRVANATLGTSVAIAGPYVALGAPGENAGRGSAYVFERIASIWSEEARVQAATALATDAFGSSVAVDGDDLIVGAPGRSTDRGATFGYRFNGLTWSEQDERLAMDTDFGDRFGDSVAISGDTVLAGAPGHMNQGAGHVFRLRFSNGDTCVTGDQCATGLCVDGVCCDTACGGGADDCQACSIAAGGREDGTCLPLRVTLALTTVCRPSVDPSCDPEELCDPRALACPADVTMCMPDLGVDLGMEDAGVSDAGVSDAGVEDAGTVDAGMDDAGTVDSDAGTMDSDAGTTDAGTTDAGTSDAATVNTDAATADAGDAPDGSLGGIVGGGCACDAAPSPDGQLPSGWLALLLLPLLYRRRRVRSARPAVALMLLAAVFGGGSAEAQSIRVERFTLAPSPDDNFAVSRPFTEGHLKFGVNSAFSYAYNPLVYESVLGDPDSETAAIVKHQLTLHTQFSLTLWDRLMVYAGVPVVVSATGDSVAGIPEADGTSVGDVSVGVRGRIYGEAGDTFILGAQVGVEVPTAEAFDEDQSYAGEGALTFAPAILAEINAGDFRADLNVGVFVRTATETVSNLDVGQQLTMGLALSYRLMSDARVEDRLLAIVEAVGATSFDRFFDRAYSPFEASIGLKGQVIEGLWLGGSVGPGFGRGYGTPDVRAVFNVGYRPTRSSEAPSDRDGDAIFDDDDTCPDDPEDYDGFEDGDGCPDPDNDSDGILDVDDQCPLEPEDDDGFANDGCPDPDNDGDGILDGDDACPDAPGPVSNQGCPETVTYDPEENTIEVTQSIQFRVDHYDLVDQSDPTLYEVRDLLRANPQLLQIRIEGHTDTSGEERYNLVLSERRARTVRDWLVDHGIAADRLEGFGCGEQNPLVRGEDADSEERNRRVEFHIMNPLPPNGSGSHGGCPEVGSARPTSAASASASERRERNGPASLTGKLSFRRLEPRQSRQNGHSMAHGVPFMA